MSHAACSSAFRSPALVGVNGLGHCLASLRLRRYLPGTFTGAALYLPLCSVAFAFAARHEDLAVGTAVAACALGIGWNAIPPLYLLGQARAQPRAT